MPEITATVVAKSTSGIKLKQDGPWWNWSLPEYRGEPFNTDVKAGDRVQITYAEKEYADRETGEPVTVHFISTIDKVAATTAEMADSIAERFPPDLPTDATNEPVEPPLDKDHSIVRQTCIKAASVALQHNMGSAEEKAGMVTYLAGVLEDWCWR